MLKILYFTLYIIDNSICDLWIAQKILSNFRGSFPKLQRYVIIWFLIFDSGPLIQVLLSYVRETQ